MWADLSYVTKLKPSIYSLTLALFPICSHHFTLLGAGGSKDKFSEGCNSVLGRMNSVVGEVLAKIPHLSRLSYKTTEFKETR